MVEGFKLCSQQKLLFPPAVLWFLPPLSRGSSGRIKKAPKLVGRSQFSAELPDEEQGALPRLPGVKKAKCVERVLSSHSPQTSLSSSSLSSLLSLFPFPPFLLLFRFSFAAFCFLGHCCGGKRKYRHRCGLANCIMQKQHGSFRKCFPKGTSMVGEAVFFEKMHYSLESTRYVY